MRNYTLASRTFARFIEVGLRGIMGIVAVAIFTSTIVLCYVQEISQAARSTMVVMLLERCQDHFTGNDYDHTSSFAKLTHLEVSSLSISMEQAVKLTSRPGGLSMLDMSYATNLRLGDVHFGQVTLNANPKH